MSGRASAASSGVGLRSERGPVLVGVMLSTALVAIDATVIATAVPSVVAELGGFAEFPWLFSVYLLAQAVTVPVYGKLADSFGRKPVMLVGIGLFLLGSVLCGAAWSMGALIAFRAVQGLGAGAVQPMSMTIVGDLYSLRERARVQGYIASVWAVSSVVGPTLGGVFSEYVSWRWIFFVNVPLCLVAAAAIGLRFAERVDRRPPRFDHTGAAVLTVALTLLVLGLLEGGQAWAWSSPQGVAVLGGGAVLLGVFVLVERRAADPVVPLRLLRSRLLVATNVVSACVGAVLLGLTSYVPTFVQDVLGTGPLVAGFALAALTLGWPISASQAGRVYLRIGMRATACVGATVVVAGAALLLLLDGSSGVLQVGATVFVIGLGMGLTAAPTLIAAQAAVGWQQRGVVTGSNMFFRSAGSAVGVAVFGAVVNATVGGSGGGVTPAALTTAVQHVFLGTTVLAVVLLVAALLMPRDRGGAPVTVTDPSEAAAG
ncbi:EmrB/QacA subfamily drug resistance transporter [Geodermatophilus tzadiensis]|uniref:EmrB/QacA subfamily drug resistance transporter n=1 Tax=Geodermatophilus tzadiensis TaxID=1137988 RepID=A0A2T0TVG1_9ACTN|nr:MDR family MFS transporter [Geodermatophilus tzadiensis]PRY49682.1 EmrB/QacA subfamily drug resistance transporter [Geodermatophilus tzadiensis]